MLTALLGLTIVSGLALIAGFVWLLASRGQTRRRTGPEAGVAVFGAMQEQDGAPDGVSFSAGRSAFHGTGVQVESEVSVDYVSIKAALRERRWREGLPPLLVMVGLSGACAFGSLALLVAWNERLLGAVIAAVVWITLIRIWLAFLRA